MSNAFVKPGQSAANKQNSQKNTASGLSLGVAKAAQPLVLNALSGMGGTLNFAQGLEPQRQSLISSQLAGGQSLLNNFSPVAQAQQAQGNAFSQGMDSVRDTIASNPSLSDSFRQALALHAQNNGVAAGNQAFQQANDPAVQAARRQQIVSYLSSLFGEAAQSPTSQLAQVIAAIMSGNVGAVTGAAPVQTGSGIGDALGGVLGSWAGSGFKTK